MKPQWWVPWITRYGCKKVSESPRFTRSTAEFGRQHAAVCGDVENQGTHLDKRKQRNMRAWGLIFSATHVLKKDMTQVRLLWKNWGNAQWWPFVSWWLMFLSVFLSARNQRHGCDLKFCWIWWTGNSNHALPMQSCIDRFLYSIVQSETASQSNCRNATWPSWKPKLYSNRLDLHFRSCWKVQFLKIQLEFGIQYFCWHPRTMSNIIASKGLISVAGISLWKNANFPHA